MILTRTPFRVSFFGGGTDYPQWADRNGGAVLSTTIGQYTYLCARRLPPFFQHRHRLTYSRVEDVKQAADVEHPALRALLLDYESLVDPDGLEINCSADLPARGGLGSSSAFIVGLLNALEALMGRRLPARELAAGAIRYEREILKENVGLQDQVATAYGGLNRIDFQAGGGFTVTPLTLAPARRKALEERLVLFFTGFARDAAEIACDQIGNFGRKSRELNSLRTLVDQAADLLNNQGPLRPFGELLHETWQLKRSLADKVSNASLDAIYQTARQNGAVGGKLLGAGGGGFFLFYVEPSERAGLARALQPLVEVPFNFETGGSRIVYSSGSRWEQVGGH